MKQTIIEFQRSCEQCGQGRYRVLTNSSFGVHYSLSLRERAGVRGSAKLTL